MRRVVSSAWLIFAGALVVSAPMAWAQVGEPRLPSFKDERRVLPRTGPTAPADPGRSAPKDAPRATDSVLQIAPTPPAPRETATSPPAADPLPVEKAAVGAPSLATPTKLAPGACDVPEIKTEPLEAGRMQISVASACRVGQDVTWSYGGIEQPAKLDASGRLELNVDAFVGTNSMVDVRFADETLFSLPLIARDLERVTKVALIWQATVDLDLHAFEYAAERGKMGHVWSGATSGLDAVRQQVQKGPRGAGYISTAAKAGGSRDKVEVYTFFHREGPGAVTFAVDHASRGEKPLGDTCGTGPQAEVSFRIVSTSRGGRPAVTRGQIARAPCDAALDTSARFDDAPLSPLRIRTQ